jgi:hypothetical protein
MYRAGITADLNRPLPGLVEDHQALAARPLAS